MAIYNEVQLQRIFIGKLKHNGDLLEELTSVCEENDIPRWSAWGRQKGPAWFLQSARPQVRIL
jgi:predicted DNA-binding protein with PD1-like motif